MLTSIALTLCIHRCRSVVTWLKSDFFRDKVTVNGNFLFHLEINMDSRNTFYEQIYIVD